MKAIETAWDREERIGIMKKRTGGWLTAALLAAAAAMCAVGAATGQAEDVLAKAARICMECIGLG